MPSNTDTPDQHQSPTIESVTAAQQLLLEAILRGKTPADSNNLHQKKPVFAESGMAPYRRGLKANATRALEVSFPTIAQLIGTRSLSALAEDYLKFDPPSSGDWGLWGARLSELLTTVESLKAYPYLADCAALDWACHLAERTADQSLESETLSLLTESPNRISLIPGMGLTVLSSNFPIVDIYHAHHKPELSKILMAQAREKINQSEGQSALVWRQHWKAQVQSLNKLEFRWYRNLSSAPDLETCLDIMSNTDFAFEQWLPEAIQQGLILGIRGID